MAYYSEDAKTNYLLLPCWGEICNQKASLACPKESIDWIVFFLQASSEEFAGYAS